MGVADIRSHQLDKLLPLGFSNHKLRSLFFLQEVEGLYHLAALHVSKCTDLILERMRRFRQLQSHFPLLGLLYFPSTETCHSKLVSLTRHHVEQNQWGDEKCHLTGNHRPLEGSLDCFLLGDALKQTEGKTKDGI